MASADSRALRFYRALLRVLPFDFRGDFGPEMETVFHEQHKEAGRRGGVARASLDGGDGGGGVVLRARGRAGDVERAMRCA